MGANGIDTRCVNFKDIPHDDGWLITPNHDRISGFDPIISDPLSP
jgi:hypothetical protein